MPRSRASRESMTTVATTERPIGGGPSLPSTFDAFRDREFAWYYVAMLGQMAAQNMLLIVRGLLVYELTGSYAYLGLLGLAGAASMLVVSMFGGVIADRLPKRSVLQTGMILGLVNAVVLASLVFLNVMRVEWLLISAFLQGCIMGFMMPSRQAIIRDLVGTERIMNAVALNVSGANTMQLVAPATGGFIAEAFGYDWAFLIMAALYGWAIIALSRVTKQPATAPGEKGASISENALSGVRDIREGMRYIVRTEPILTLLLVSLVGAVLGMPFRFLLAGYVADIFNGGGSQLGLLISIMAVGSLAGTLALASIPNRNRGVLLLFGMLLLGLGLAVFAQTTQFWVASAIIMFVGLGSAFRQALSQGLVQYYVDDAYRGRVMSVYMAQFSMMQLGTFVIGIAAEFIGVREAFTLLGISLVVVTIAIYLFVPRVRQLQ